MLTEKDTDARRTTLNKVLFKAMYRTWIAEGTFEEDVPMDTFEEHCRWFYLAECGEWHMFDVNPSERCSLTNREIELNYGRNCNGFMEYRVGECTYRLDFSEMKQINLTTGMQRPITRSLHSPAGHTCLGGKPPLPVPSLWETDLPFQLIPLDSDTQECQNVVKQFAETMPNVPIRSIKRIQNIKLWESFCRTKTHLGQIKQMNIDERMLFHGTAHENIRPICTSNFDLRFAGTNGSVYGKGIYFARNASFSKKYCSVQKSHKGISPSNTMILARVLVGEYTQGAAMLCQAPSKDQTKTSFYDSCVDTFTHPTMFVVFDNNQVYPEYLIEF